MAIEQPPVELVEEAPVEIPPGQGPDIVEGDDSAFTGEEQQVAGRFNWGGNAVSSFTRDRKLRDIMDTVGRASTEATEKLLDDNPIGRFIDPARNDDRNFGLHVIDNVDDIHRIIDDTSIVIGGDQPRFQRRGWQATSDAADSGGSLTDIIGRAPDRAWNAEQLLRARQLMVAGAREISQDAQRLRALADPDDRELWLFRKKLATYVALQKSVQGAVKEAGRALNAMQIPVGPNDLANFNASDAIKQLGGQKMNMKMVQLVADAGDDPAAIAKVSRGAWYRRGWDALMEVWINGLLSSPSTHATNIVGNFFTSALAVPERYTAAIVGAIRTGGGRWNKVGGSERVTFGEAHAQAYGWAQGQLFGWQAMVDALKKGEEFHQGRDLLDPNNNKASTLSRRPAVTAENLGIAEGSMLGRGIDLMGKWYVRMPGRFLEAEDEYFKAVGYVMELNALAYRQAWSEGLEVGSDAFNKRLREIVNDPPEDLHAGAYNFARNQTFTNDLAQGSYTDATTNSTYSRMMLDFSRTPIGRLFVPFVRTPTNILKFGLRRSPAGLMMPSVWNDFKAGGAAADLAIARIGLGSGVMGLGYMMFNNYETGEDGVPIHRPIITGAGPADWDRRKAWELSGIKPYSIYINGTYYQYNRYDPFGQQLGSIANMLEIINDTYNEEERSDAIEAAILGTAEYFTDRSFMQGFGEMIDLLNFKDKSRSPIGKIQRWTARTGASFVPNWLARATKDYDPISRNTRGGTWLDEWMNASMAKIPWLSDNVPPRYDMLGNVIHHQEPIAYLNLISPSTYSVAKKNPELSMHIIENSVGDVAPMDGSIPVQWEDARYGLVSERIDLYDVDPTGWLFSDYSRLLGQRVHEGMSRVTTKQQFKDAAVGIPRQTLLEAAAVAARSDVIAELFGNGRARAEVLAVKKKYEKEINAMKNQIAVEYTRNGGSIVTMPPHYTEQNAPTF